jgi:hypothetical protein
MKYLIPLLFLLTSCEMEHVGYMLHFPSESEKALCKERGHILDNYQFSYEDGEQTEEIIDSIDITFRDIITSKSSRPKRCRRCLQEIIKDTVITERHIVWSKCKGLEPIPFDELPDDGRSGVQRWPIRKVYREAYIACKDTIPAPIIKRDPMTLAEFYKKHPEYKQMNEPLLKKEQ